MACGHIISICCKDIMFCLKHGQVNVYSPIFSLLPSSPPASQSLAKVVDDFWMFEVELVYKWNILLISVENRLPRWSQKPGYSPVIRWSETVLYMSTPDRYIPVIKMLICRIHHFWMSTSLRYIFFVLIVIMAEWHCFSSQDFIFVKLRIFLTK